jgi:hypothetical protein
MPVLQAILMLVIVTGMFRLMWSAPAQALVHARYKKLSHEDALALMYSPVYVRIRRAGFVVGVTLVCWSLIGCEMLHLGTMQSPHVLTLGVVAWIMGYLLPLGWLFQ